MKLLILFIVLLLAGVTLANMAEWHTITDWVCSQNYTKAQLNGVTRTQVRTIAENHGFSDTQIRRLMTRHRSLLNVAWSDWRQRRIEAARGLIELKVREYDADAVVLYAGQATSSVDPNNTTSVFSIEVDLELER